MARPVIAAGRLAARKAPSPEEIPALGAQPPLRTPAKARPPMQRSPQMRL